MHFGRLSRKEYVLPLILVESVLFVDQFAGGMERVVCVSHAKVPIVKIWDPELRLACDMNVNNTSALENTRMIGTYVSIDKRVRQLAMTIKYWTRRRVLNDAGSYILFASLFLAEY
jgi:DNA polymerase sigma